MSDRYQKHDTRGGYGRRGGHPKYRDNASHQSSNTHRVIELPDDVPTNMASRLKIPTTLEGCISVFCDPAALSPSFGMWRELLKEPKVYGIFGIHPHNAKYYDDNVERRIEQCIAEAGEKAVAWGETGLDYHYNHSTKEQQQNAFRRQILKAIEHKKPLVVHSRDAADDTFKIMRELLPQDHPVHIHCFTDDKHQAERLLSHFSNLYIGFTGVITYDTAEKVREAAQAVSLDRILLETDGPYMTPRPYNGVCHSGFIPIIAKQIADVKQVDPSVVLTAARNNTKRLYGI